MKFFFHTITQARWISQTGTLLLLSFALLEMGAHATYRQEARVGTPASEIPPELKDIGIDEQLGRKISLDELQFRNEKGERVTLRSFFKTGKPVLLNLVYFECPSLCTLALNGLVQSLKAFEWDLGTQFEVVTVSIDHREDAALAEEKKAVYLEQYGRGGELASSHWHFLTGDQAPIEKLSAELGFKFKYDETTKQYAHAAGTFVLTPDGVLSRVLYGVEYAPRELRLGLLEASNGKIGTIVDRFMLFCYKYDPATRKYGLVATRLVQAGSAGMVLILGGYLSVFWRKQRRNSPEKGSGNSEGGMA